MVTMVKEVGGSIIVDAGRTCSNGRSRENKCSNGAL